MTYRVTQHTLGDPSSADTSRMFDDWLDARAYASQLASRYPMGGQSIGAPRVLDDGRTVYEHRVYDCTWPQCEAEGGHLWKIISAVPE